MVLTVFHNPKQDARAFDRAEHTTSTTTHDVEEEATTKEEAGAGGEAEAGGSAAAPGGRKTQPVTPCPGPATGVRAWHTTLRAQRAMPRSTIDIALLRRAVFLPPFASQTMYENEVKAKMLADMMLEQEKEKAKYQEELDESEETNRTLILQFTLVQVGGLYAVRCAGSARCREPRRAPPPGWRAGSQAGIELPAVSARSHQAFVFFPARPTLGRPCRFFAVKRVS